MQRRAFLQHAAALAALPLVSGRMHAQAKPLHTNGSRLNGWLTQFDRIGRTPTGINRVAYSEADLAGRAFTLDLFKQSGLATRLDTAGNIFARVDGSSVAKSRSSTNSSESDSLRSTDDLPAFV